MTPSSLHSIRWPGAPFLLGAVSLLVLFTGFYSNTWRASDEFLFEHHRIDTEGLVVGRIVQSRHEGILSRGGFLGIGSTNDVPDPEAWITFEFQYHAYTNDLAFATFSTYRSQSGVQGMWFSALDQLPGIPARHKLALFHGLNSLLTAVVLALVVVWFHHEFGLAAALCVLVSTAACQWLPLFARNLYWSLWAFYLPMAVLLYHLHRTRLVTVRDYVRLGVVTFVALLLKCSLNGYEYITTTLVMLAVPVIYYGLAGGVSFPSLAAQMLAVSVGSILAILLSASLLCAQIGAEQGGFSEGFEHLKTSYERRTRGNPEDFAPALDARLQSSVGAVLLGYLKATFLDLNHYVTSSHPFISRILLKVRYAHLIGLFCLASGWYAWYLSRHLPEPDRVRVRALVWAAWFSLLGPLSWFVVFKAHSIVHARINSIVWQMPFTLFGFALGGLVLDLTVRRFLRRRTTGQAKHLPTGLTG